LKKVDWLRCYYVWFLRKYKIKRFSYKNSR
jgi:hypothetical protein